MAKTKISDVIVPEVFAAYVIQMTKELSALIQSGVAISNPKLDELVTQGGKLINMPFWKPITGEEEVLSDSDSLTPAKITTDADVAALLIRGKAWSSNELAGALAGDSPMRAISAQLAGWWSRREQAILISILNGIFATALAGTHVNNISGASGEAAVISGNAILDTKQLLGDASDQLTALATHSAVYTTLQKQNLITFIPNSRGEINIPTYMGYRLIVDDGCPNAEGVYTTYMFGAGCFGRGDGVPVDITPVETDRDSLASDDILINRRALVLHPFGVKFTNNTVSGATPTNAELATGANWAKVYEDKAIGIAMLKHRIAEAPELDQSQN
ncbi:MAG: coat protein [Peptococcaceae bacterium]|jgi:hypothetical protein|nr:coat protein [Peptococcaceae bacterium]